MFQLKKIRPNPASRGYYTNILCFVLIEFEVYCLIRQDTPSFYQTIHDSIPQNQKQKVDKLTTSSGAH